MSWAYAKATGFIGSLIPWSKAQPAPPPRPTTAAAPPRPTFGAPVDPYNLQALSDALKVIETDVRQEEQEERKASQEQLRSVIETLQFGLDKEKTRKIEILAQTQALEQELESTKTILKMCIQKVAFAKIIALITRMPEAQKLLEFTVAQGVHVNACDGEEESSAFHILAVNNCADRARVLFVCGARPDIKNGQGRTPLHLAAYKGHDQMMQFLVEDCKASVNETDKEGETPLDKAYQQGFSAAILVTHGATLGSTLHTAAALGKKLLLYHHMNQEGVDLNGPDSKGNTALYLAIRNRQVDAANTLIMADADCKRLSNGKSPLMAAARRGLEAIVLKLLDKGADTTVDWKGKKAIDYARAAGHSSIVTILEQRDAELQAYQQGSFPTSVQRAQPNASPFTVKKPARVIELPD